jgi:hypothetical protein
MGLLDDAIRDHLELKRLRGADPGEVAREQKEALTPVLGDEDATADEDPLLSLEDFNIASAPTTPSVGETTDGDAQPTSQLALGADLGTGGQETAELDMRTVLGDGDGAAPDGPAADHRGEDPLEWEVPGDSSGETTANPGAHDRAMGGPGA